MTDAFLQDLPQDDGIDTVVENAGNLLDEELDYEDDLSVDDGDFTGEESGSRESSFEGEMDIQQQLTATQGEAGTSQPRLEASGSQNPLTSLTEEQLHNNHVIQRMMQDIIKDQFQNMQQTLQQGKQSDVNNPMESQVGNRVAMSNKNAHINSPSDTTIYAPVMQLRMTQVENTAILSLQGDQAKRGARIDAVFNPVNGKTGQAESYFMVGEGSSLNNDSGDNTNVIAHFVENIRLQQHPEDAAGDDSSGDRRRGDMAAAKLESAQKKAERTILEAEEFQASIEMPGMSQNNKILGNKGIHMQNVGNNDGINLLNIGSGVSDDDFFSI